MKSRILLVDFENVKDVSLTLLSSVWRVMIFVGKSQHSIPFSLTRDAQRFGDRLEWVKIGGDGKNNLDFHLAYYLGRLAHEFADADFVILSKDKGFDPLIIHMGQQHVECRRIGSLEELDSRQSEREDEHFKRAFEVMSKAKKSRPRKRKALAQHVSSLFQKKLPPEEIQRIVDTFLKKGLIVETENVLSYEF